MMLICIVSHDLSHLNIFQAPLVTMAVGLTVANLGIMPFASPICAYTYEACVFMLIAIYY